MNRYTNGSKYIFFRMHAVPHTKKFTRFTPPSLSYPIPYMVYHTPYTPPHPRFTGFPYRDPMGRSRYGRKTWIYSWVSQTRTLPAGVQQGSRGRVNSRRVAGRSRRGDATARRGDATTTVSGRTTGETATGPSTTSPLATGGAEVGRCSATARRAAPETKNARVRMGLIMPPNTRAAPRLPGS